MNSSLNTDMKSGEALSIKVGFCLLIFTILNACHPLFCGWDYGYKQLTGLATEDNVAGDYQLTEESLKYVMSKGYKKIPTLILLESGTFNLINAPDLLFDPVKDNSGKAQNKNGKWSVGCAESYGCMIELEHIAVVPLSRKGEGPLAIPLKIGDGDECNGIIFEQMK